MTPSYNHSYLAYRIGKSIDVDDKYNIHIELTLTIDDAEYIADVAIYEKHKVNFLRDKIKTKTLPLMVVEILSPTQSITELTDKAELYLSKGINSCWLVIPPTKTIIVFHDINQPNSYSTGKLIDSVLNIEIDVAEIFN